MGFVPGVINPAHKVPSYVDIRSKKVAKYFFCSVFFLSIIFFGCFLAFPRPVVINLAHFFLSTLLLLLLFLIIFSSILLPVPRGVLITLKDESFFYPNVPNESFVLFDRMPPELTTDTSCRYHPMPMLQVLIEGEITEVLVRLIQGVVVHHEYRVKIGEKLVIPQELVAKKVTPGADFSIQMTVMET
jgi:hypothetical protein